MSAVRDIGDWEAVAIDPADDVAVALGEVEGLIRVRRGDEIVHIRLARPVAMGHKIALRDIAAGAPVRKYGEVIGAAIVDIAAGAHVHVHNLRSRRAQAGAVARDAPTPRLVKAAD